MHKLIFILFLSLTSFIRAQDLNAELIQTLPNNKTIQFVSQDHLGNVYLLENNQITKKTLEKTYHYSNLLYGEITSIDTRNPMQVLVFYKDFQTFVLLDNQLNEVQNVNLTVLFPELDVRLVSASIKNTYWIFDSISQKIFLFNISKNELKQVSNPLDNSFKFWNSNANHFFFESENQIHVFDIYGKMTSSSIKITYDQLFPIEPSQFIIKDKADLFYINNITNHKTKINRTEKSFNSFHYTNDILTIFTDSEIYIYKLKTP